MEKNKSKDKNTFSNPILSILLIFFALIGGLIPVALYKVRQLIIDSAVGVIDNTLKDIAILLAIYLGFVFVEQLLTNIKDRILDKAIIKQAFFVDASLKKKIAKVKLSCVESQRYNELLAETDEIAESLTTKYTTIYNLCVGGVYLLSSFVVLIFTDIFVFAVTFVLLAANLIINIVAAKRTKGMWAKYRFTMRKANHFSAILTDRQYATEKKIFGYYGYIQQKFETEFDSARKSNIQLGRKRMTIEMLAEIVTAAFSVSILIGMLFPLLNNGITIGVYTSLFFLVKDVMSSGNTICSSLFELNIAKHTMRSVNELMLLPEENQDGVKPHDPHIIEFQNVSFSYPDFEELVLDKVSFCLDLSKTYALVGENGCGKSTLVKLMLGLYEPNEGQILIDGSPLSDLGRANINKIFSAVFQNSYEYPLTLGENLFLSQDTDKDIAQFNEVCQNLELTELTDKLPNGLNTDLSLLKADSVNLSGGEWQKVAIARRCLLSQSKMAILDEPNAALDPIAEVKVYRAYGQILKNRGALLISHRLGSIKDVNEILVLKNGRLIANAAHDELMATCDYYKELYTAQRSMYYEE